MEGLPRFRRRKLSASEKVKFCENWRLSYYKTIVVMLLLITAMSTVLLIPFTYINYYHDLYHNNPEAFLAINNVYTISIFMIIYSFFFTFVYFLGRAYYSIPRAERLSILFNEAINTGKRLQRNKEGFIPTEKRGEVELDLWIVKLLIRSFNIDKFTIEERFGVREFTANLELFKRVLRYSNRKQFLKISGDLEMVVSALGNLSQPQVFLTEYYELKYDYNNLRKDSEAQFDTNKLYDINKGLTLNRLKGEIRTLQLNNIITLILIVFILILFLLQVFVYHGIQIPTIPNP